MKGGSVERKNALEQNNFLRDCSRESSNAMGKIWLSSNRLNGQTYFSIHATFSCLIHKVYEFMTKTASQDFRIGVMGMRIPRSFFNRSVEGQGISFSKKGTTVFCGRWLQGAAFCSRAIDRLTHARFWYARLTRVRVWARAHIGQSDCFVLPAN